MFLCPRGGGGGGAFFKDALVTKVTYRVSIVLVRFPAFSRF